MNLHDYHVMHKSIKDLGACDDKTEHIEISGYYQIFVESGNYDPVQVEGSYIIK